MVVMTPDESRYWAKIVNALAATAETEVRQSIVRKVRDNDLAFTDVEADAIAAAENWLSTVTT